MVQYHVPAAGPKALDHGILDVLVGEDRKTTGHYRPA